MIKFCFDPKNNAEQLAWRIHVKNEGDLKNVKFPPRYKKHYRNALSKPKAKKHGIAICQTGDFVPITNEKQIVEKRECVPSEVW